jgi:hypothetical protein
MTDGSDVLSFVVAARLVAASGTIVFWNWLEETKASNAHIPSRYLLLKFV